MERCPRFVFGTDDLSLTISARPWLPKDATVGGARTAASGVPAAYIIRRDALLDLTLRFYEDEWPSVLNLLAYGQTGQSFTWYPDAADDTDSTEVYLESHKPAELIAPSRDAEFARVFELTITLRGVGASVPWRSYFLLS